MIRVSQTLRLRAGITLIELLVSIGMIGVLVSLLMPAIHAVRESARRMQCKSNLKQLGIAVLAYESEHRMLPPGELTFGFEVRLLPYLEHAELYELAVNSPRINGQSQELAGVPVRALRCPSDSVRSLQIRPSGDMAVTNYGGSSGTGVQSSGFNGLFRHWSIIVPAYKGHGPVALSDVTDGPSNTAAMSEFLPADGSWDRLRVHWNTPQTLPDDQFATLCSRIPDSPKSHGWLGDNYDKGAPWSHGAQGVTFYNHLLTPNQPSCYNGTDVFAGAYTAASLHSGGVNLLFADGHVEFIGDGVSSSVWKAYGSRSAGD